jgi:recombination protein RecA
MKTLEQNAKELNKQFGNVAFYEGQEIEFEPTGLLPLDYAIGLGGLPVGRIIEVHGQFSCGKTSLCLAIISNFQKRDIPCAFIDAEYAHSAKHAASMGVDNSKLLLIQPDFGEQAFEIMEKIIKDGTAKLIVVDSVSALTPKSEAEAEFGKPQMGSQARLMATGMRKLVGLISKQKAIVIFINQLRMNIMGGQYDPYTLPGGQSLKHYSSVMMELKKEKALMKGDKIVGYPIHIKIKKNKVGLPGEECEVQLFFSSGFSAEASILDLGEKAGLIKKDGNTYFSGEIKLGVGQNKARQYLIDNPLVAEELRAKL